MTDLEFLKGCGIAPDSPNSYCPYPVDSEDLTRSVIAICDFSGETEAGK